MVLVYSAGSWNDQQDDSTQDLPGERHHLVGVRRLFTRFAVLELRVVGDVEVAEDELAVACGA